jgi:hypothetical protein
MHYHDRTPSSGFVLPATALDRNDSVIYFAYSKDNLTAILSLRINSGKLDTVIVPSAALVALPKLTASNNYLYFLQAGKNYSSIMRKEKATNRRITLLTVTQTIYDYTISEDDSLLFFATIGVEKEVSENSIVNYVRHSDIYQVKLESKHAKPAKLFSFASAGYLQLDEDDLYFSNDGQDTTTNYGPLKFNLARKKFTKLMPTNISELSPQIGNFAVKYLRPIPSNNKSTYFLLSSRGIFEVDKNTLKGRKIFSSTDVPASSIDYLTTFNNGSNLLVKCSIFPDQTRLYILDSLGVTLRVINLDKDKLKNSLHSL